MCKRCEIESDVLLKEGYDPDVAISYAPTRSLECSWCDKTYEVCGVAWAMIVQKKFRYGLCDVHMKSRVSGRPEKYSGPQNKDDYESGPWGENATRALEGD